MTIVAIGSIKRAVGRSRRAAREARAREVRTSEKSTATFRDCRRTGAGERRRASASARNSRRARRATREGV